MEVAKIEAKIEPMANARLRTAVPFFLEIAASNLFAAR
jgi:hypothetical protein